MLLAACVALAAAQPSGAPALLRPSFECWRGDGAAPPSYDLVIAVMVGSDRERLASQRGTWMTAAAPGTGCAVLSLIVRAQPTPPTPSYTHLSASEVELTLAEPDSYENLPRKVVGSLAWLSAHVAFKLVLKTDDDTWICVPELLAALAPLPRTGLYWGRMNERHQLIASITHKGSVHTDFAAYFQTARYPTYAFGAAYALSADVAAAVSDAAALRAARHVQIEDVLIGALVARALPTLAPTAMRSRGIALGYNHNSTSSLAAPAPDSPAGPGPHRLLYLRKLCATNANGGKKGWLAMVVHRVGPDEVRLCHNMARMRCARKL